MIFNLFKLIFATCLLVFHVYSLKGQTTATPNLSEVPYDSLRTTLEAIYETDQEIRKELTQLMRENASEVNKSMAHKRREELTRMARQNILSGL